MYYGVFFTIYAAVVVCTLVASRRPPIRRLLMPSAIAAVVAIVLAVPLIRAYSESTKTKGERGRGEVLVFSATPTDYLRAHFRSAVYGSRMLSGRQPERALAVVDLHDIGQRRRRTIVKVLRVLPHALQRRGPVHLCR